MTGKELTAIQHAAAMSDRTFLEWLAIRATSTARRKLRRWKDGELPIPEDIVRNVRRSFAEECQRLGV